MNSTEIRPQTLAMKSVYAVPWVETQEMFNMVQLPARIWRMTTPVEEHNDFLASYGVGPIVPGTQKLGLLDCWNEPVMDSIEQNSGIAGLHELPSRYPTAGTAQAIGHILAHLRHHHDVTQIFVPSGDYEGYQYQAENYGIETVHFDINGPLPSGQWVFLSCPSAIDGNEISEAILTSLCADNRTIIDYAYHGLTSTRTRVTPQNVWGALWSMSKPYGLFYRRVGFAWLSEPVPALHSTRWFKNPEALLAAAKVVKEFSPADGWIYDTSRKHQIQAIELCKPYFDGLVPSDCLLLANTRIKAETWRRDGQTARICVSPAIEHLALSRTHIKHLVGPLVERDGSLVVL